MSSYTDHPPALSNDAVTTMLNGHRSVPFPSTPLVVLVSARTRDLDPDWDDDNYDDNYYDGDHHMGEGRNRAVWVEDATSRVRARLVGPVRHALSRLLENSSPHPCRVIVKGYITCEVNPGSPRPVLFLADAKVVDLPPMREHEIRRRQQRQHPQHQLHNPKPLATLPTSRVHGGTVFEFLDRTAPQLLANGQLGHADDCSVVTNFLEHVRALETLQSSSWGSQTLGGGPPRLTVSTSSMSSSASTASSSSPREEAGSLLGENTANNNSSQTPFAAALAEFERSQLDRQSATLASHVSRNPDTADAVVSKHRDAVQAATTYGAMNAAGGGGGSLTVDVLCEWHRIACDGLISSTAGQTRTRAVRVGNVSFRPASEARSDLVRVCNGLAALEARLQSAADPTSTPTLPLGSRAALFASVVLFAVVDTHAFADGNGRVARIAANYALRKFGFPVPIALFATASQRREYTQATVETRRNVYLLARGDVDPGTLLEAYGVAGAFTPLLKLFLDRMEKAVAELTNLVRDKQRLVQEELHHQEARLFRERAAQGTCLICFDETPNITTLCCGKAVHLNCMAEWLTTNTTCPNCRGDFPALPHRIAGRQPVVEDNDDDDDDDLEVTTTDDDDDDDNNSTMSDPIASDQVARNVAEVLASAYARAGIAAHARVGFAVAAAASHPEGTEEDSDDNTTTEDDDDDGGHNNAQSLGAAAMATDDTTTVDDDDRCLHCSNMAARDCQNRLCGRCCQSSGQYQCARHGIFG